MRRGEEGCGGARRGEDGDGVEEGEGGRVSYALELREE